MNANDYQRLAARTEADAEAPRMRIANLYGTDHTSMVAPTRLLHALLGLMTEAGELADVLKKHLFYGKRFDGAHADEEVGDLLWYVALYCNARGVGMGDLMAANVAKLRARYPDRFTEEAALTRDLAKERQALHNHPQTVPPGQPGYLPCPACDQQHPPAGREPGVD